MINIIIWKFLLLEKDMFNIKVKYEHRGMIEDVNP